jgi:isopentenyl phosphate kinase
VYGDAAPDRTLGGTVASTEPLLAALAALLRPTLIVLATDVDGVYGADPQSPTADPSRLHRVERITPANGPELLERLGGARSGTVDVTGGMATKVASMLDLVAEQPEIEVRILSGLRPGAVLAALQGRADAGGTVLRAGTSADAPADEERREP